MRSEQLLIVVLVCAMTGLLTPAHARAQDRAEDRTHAGGQDRAPRAGASLSVVGAAADGATAGHGRATRSDGPLADPQPGDPISVLTTEPAFLRVELAEGTTARVDFVDGPAGGMHARCVGTAGGVRCDPSFSRTVRDDLGGSPVISLLVPEQGVSTAVLRIDAAGGRVTSDDEVADVDEVTSVEPWTHVTFGDSFTSGVGVGAGWVPDSSADSRSCERSVLAFAHDIDLVGPDGTNLGGERPMVTADHPDAFRSVPCSGARLRHLLDPHPSGAPPQFAEAEVEAGDPSVDLVTLTLGGNDMVFSGVLSHCLVGVWRRADCFATDFHDGRSLADLAPDLLRQLRDRHRLALDAIVRRVPNAVVVQGGYPQVLDVGAGRCWGLSRAERSFLEHLTAQTNATIRSEVDAAGGLFVDVEGRFAGHGVCGGEPWIHGYVARGRVDLRPASASFHPMPTGHVAYATAVNEALAAARLRHGPRVDGLPDLPGRRARRAWPPHGRQAGPPADGPADGDLPVFADAVVQVSSGCPFAAPGDTITVTADGFAPGAAVTIEVVDGDTGGRSEGVADAEGRLTSSQSVTRSHGLVGASLRGRAPDGTFLASSGLVQIDPRACATTGPTAEVLDVDVDGSTVTVRFGCADADRCTATVNRRQLASGQPVVLPPGRHHVQVLAARADGRVDVAVAPADVGVPLTPTLGGVRADALEVVVSRPSSSAAQHTTFALTTLQEGHDPVLTAGSLPEGALSATVVVPLSGGGRTAVEVRVSSPDGWGTEVLRTTTDAPVRVERVAGSGRHATAAALAARTHPQGADTVLLARADDPADALAAGPLAAALGAPVLLTDAHRLNPETSAAIGALGADRAVILGGPAAVGDAVAGQLRRQVAVVDRIGGPERTATAALVADALADVAGTGLSVVVASARAWAPALVASGLAAARDAPILLAEPHGLSDATRRALVGYERVIVVGDVGEGAATDLASLPVDHEILWSSDPVALSHLVDRSIRDEGGTVLLASASAPADALAASGAAGRLGATIVLIDDDRRLREWIQVADPPSRALILGGPAAVPATTEEVLRGP